MDKNTSEDSLSCKKYRPLHEYTYLQQFIDNVPYIIMIILGAFILSIGLELSIWGWVAAGVFVLYGVVGAFWIIVFVCPYCHYYDSRACPCGYGLIAAKLRSKKDGDRFIEKFKKHIGVIVPLWIIPILVGGITIIFNFYWEMLVLVMAFALNSFIILPLISRKYGCAHCPQRDACLWMGRRGRQK
jgi:hypothetical protein